MPMDTIEIASEIVEMIAALAIIAAWMSGMIHADDLIGQIVVLVAVVAIFGDAAIKVIRLKSTPISEGGRSVG